MRIEKEENLVKTGRPKIKDPSRKEGLIVEEVEQSAQLHQYNSPERVTGDRYPT